MMWPGSYFITKCETVASRFFVYDTNRAARELVSPRKLKLTVLYSSSHTPCPSLYVLLYIGILGLGEFTKRLVD